MINILILIFVIPGTSSTCLTTCEDHISIILTILCILMMKMMAILRNILHVPDNVRTANKKCSNQNQIMWNLFAQNLDKTILDLIAHQNSGVWCVSVVQLVALVYKDQHVITLQKLLQDFLESNLSESSEDNESNTSNQYQPGSCSPSSDDSSDQQPSRDNSPTHMVHSPESSHSCGSLNVLPNNSPAPSTDPGSLDNPASPMSVQSNPMTSAPNNGANSREATPPVVEEEEVQEEFVQPSPVSTNPPKGENTSSGIDSEIFSRGNSSEGNSGGEQPPHKVYMSENEKGEKVIVERRTTEPTEYVHKQRRTDKMLVPPNAPRRAPKSPTKNAKVGASSSEDEHQKPLRTNPVKPRAQVAPKLSPDDKKEKHRQKLLKKSRENRMRVKAMVNHIPTDKDISELLKEFTVDFLHNGYSKLVKELLEKLSRKDCDISMDKSHFLWLLTYFLKFASQLEIGLDQIGKVMSFATLSYVTYEGVDLLETLELAHREQKDDLGPHLRRIHLVVTALREFFQTVASYNEIKHLSLNEKKHIETLRLQTLYARDCRQLLVLLLRRFNPQSQTLQYLCDTVVCNHMLLLDLELVSDSENLKGQKFNMRSHVRQFANAEMMRHFGRLLEEYEKNTPFVNDCIFTVMHHIAGDLDSPQTLYIPSILKSF